MNECPAKKKIALIAAGILVNAIGTIVDGVDYYQLVDGVVSLIIIFTGVSLARAFAVYIIALLISWLSGQFSGLK